jgi:proline dehydrogenase
MLRQTFLFLSRRRALRRWMETSRAAARLTSRFVAGQTLADVLGVSARLQQAGLLATLDHLGENVTTTDEARASRDAMLEALGEIHRRGLTATISIKLTQFGLDLGDAVCRANVEAVVRRAAELGNRVEIDMESSEYTSRTLAIVEAMHSLCGCVRAVVQAYLHRTAEDIARLNSLAIPVRLCKGAYKEPPSAALQAKRDVDANYLKLARLLLDQGVHPAFATHDPAMIDGVLDYARQQGAGPDRFEFQMLYGVRRDLQQRLAASGFLVRLYVPYGDAWYPYFMRRLAERPANAFFIFRHLLRA